MLAWDLVECIVLIRQGYGAGYIEEAEAWRRLEVLGKRLQRAYESFEEIGEIWCIGVEIRNDPQAQEARSALEKLKSDEKSPWRTTPWDLKLSKLDGPQPASPAPTKPSPPEPGGKHP